MEVQIHTPMVKRWCGKIISNFGRSERTLLYSTRLPQSEVQRRKSSYSLGNRLPVNLELVNSGPVIRNRAVAPLPSSPALWSGKRKGPPCPRSDSCYPLACVRG